MPQSVERITDRLHSPPRIRVQSIPTYLLAPVLTLYRQGSSDAAQSCHCRLDLTVPEVDEDDPSVDLKVRWFVDYDLSQPRSLGVVKEETVQGSFDVGDVVRGPFNYSFEADALGIVSSGVHVVQVVIAESAGFDENSTTLPHRAVKTAEGYESTVYTFVVDVRVEQDPKQPTCPQQLPSKRVCQ